MKHMRFLSDCTWDGEEGGETANAPRIHMPGCCSHVSSCSLPRLCVGVAETARVAGSFTAHYKTNETQAVA